MQRRPFRWYVYDAIIIGISTGIFIFTCSSIIRLSNSTAVSAQVPLTVQKPSGTFENGHVRIYELGATCYVVASDAPMGSVTAAVACRSVCP